MAVQQHAMLPKIAVAGFLRDDGTAVCKKRDWKANEMSLYKVVLLNLQELKKLDVEYQQNLKMYEDICLTHEVLRAGGHTLKCQCFCYRASHASKGGCDDQRVSRKESGTHLNDLMAASAFERLTSMQQSAVIELLDWVRGKEDWSKMRSGRAGAESRGHTGATGDSKTPSQKLSLDAHEDDKKQKKSNETREEEAERRKRKRDYKKEYRMRKKRATAKKAAERAERRARGLPSSPGRSRRSCHSRSSSSSSNSSRKRSSSRSSSSTASALSSSEGSTSDGEDKGDGGQHSTETAEDALPAQCEQDDAGKKQSSLSS